jgi:hypothetical protein
MTPLTPLGLAHAVREQFVESSRSEAELRIKHAHLLYAMTMAIKLLRRDRVTEAESILRIALREAQ